MEHLFKSFEMKANEAGKVAGFFSTYDKTPDSYGDIIEPGAFTKTLENRKATGEAFALGTPLLLHDPIPGPETENAVYATRHGAAIWLHPGERLSPAVEELFAGDALPRMRQRALDCARPLASEEIVKIILQSAGF